MENINKCKYVNQLDITTKNKIVEELQQLGLTHDDIINALNSRLIDLNDTINIDKYLDITS